MAEIDFSNIDEAETWFETQSVEKRCTMASRAALRSATVLGRFEGNDKDARVLSVFRAILTSARRGLGHPADVDRLESAADSTANAAASVATAAACSDRSAIAAAATAARASVAIPAAYSDRSAIAAAATAATAVYSAARSDARLSAAELRTSPLWPDKNARASLATAHDNFLTYLSGDPDWAF